MKTHLKRPKDSKSNDVSFVIFELLVPANLDNAIQQVS